MKPRSFNLLVILALVLSLLGSVANNTPAYAAGIVVNTAADEDTNNANCSLREAITAANTNVTYNGCPAGSGADTITFAADYTITLLGSQLPSVSSTINIIGNGAARTIIQANADPDAATYRVFHVSGGGDLTFEGLTVRHGRCAGTCAGVLGDIGGGVLNQGNLNVINSTLTGNTASEGGALFNDINGTATITDSIFRQNIGEWDSGAIGNIGIITITGSEFSQNSAILYGGGAIVNSFSGTATIANSTISDNSAPEGGGIAIPDANAITTLINVTISDNTGGGVYNLGNLNVINSAFTGNAASIGGGIYNEGIATVTNGAFTANIAAVDGGGIGNTGILTVNHGTFQANNGTDGAGISSIGTATITNSTFLNNSVSDRGGGIANGGILTVTNTTFEGNSASHGGGILNIADSGMGLGNASATISNSTFTNNTVTQNGGALFSHASGTGVASTTVYNSTITGNHANQRGGGASAETANVGTETSTILLRNSLVYGNTAAILNPNCNVINTGASLVGNANNLFPASGDFCPTGALDVTTSAALITVISSLEENGGPTQTMSLPTGSPAINAGNATTCNNVPVSGKDQRGVTRPQGAGCDIGAFESGPIIPVVSASNPSANAILTSLSPITVVFNQDMLDNATADGAENVNNYLLVERGANASFDTISCDGGVVSDDVQQTISTASYNSAGFVASLTLASPLSAGTYRLFVCGTTSIWSVAGLELNNGVNDYTVDFTIGTTGAARNENKTTASSLPKTGFAPGKVTVLPAQPADLAYAKLGDLWLEIPSLNVKSTIVGVPQNKDNSWDVSWLGNDTGWLNGTAFPTWNGNSVLTAHVTNASGVDGPFAALKSLKYGDQVIVHFGGVQYVYEVRETKLSRPYSTNFAFESKSDAAYLTLITCSGYNPLNESYLFRRVVRAVLVSTVSE